MKPSYLFMGASWAVILALFIYSLVRTLREKDEDASTDRTDETPGA